VSTAQLQRLADLEEIRQLTVNYAKATDDLGSADADRRATGRELYRRTFASDAKIEAGESGVKIGPDAWADFVAEALAVFSATQHLVGTIDLELDDATDDKPASTGTMATYLYATHEYAPEGDLWIVLGTYYDEVTRTAEGWRISKRLLTTTSAEMRKHGKEGQEAV
jgi:hypothetical protein